MKALLNSRGFIPAFSKHSASSTNTSSNLVVHRARRKRRELICLKGDLAEGWGRRERIPPIAEYSSISFEHLEIVPFRDQLTMEIGQENELYTAVTLLHWVVMCVREFS
jgi:hypothetical protein